jgi:hypothetical protein
MAAEGAKIWKKQNTTNCRITGAANLISTVTLI